MRTEPPPARGSRRLVLAIALVSVLAVTGCGGSEKVVAVSGVVTHNGQPVSGLVVSFVPDAATETGVSTGETDADGRYTLTVVKSRASGAVVGKHKVWVSLPREALAGDKNTEDDREKEERAKARTQKPKTNRTATEIAAILKTYGRLDTTPLEIEVKDGSPIDIKLD